jgi:hypothetical protein
MSTQGDLRLIQGIMEGLKKNPVERFSYTQEAFDNDDVDGVEVFDVSAEQNIPSAGNTDYNTTVLNKGVRSQGASIPRLGWNHYIGRLSYNVNKLVQRLDAFFKIHRASLAHNANAYDENAQYRPGDICFVTNEIRGVKVYSWHKRISLTPEFITNIAPGVNLHWEQMQEKTSYSSLLPFSAPGYRHKYFIVDLTEFDADKFYPVITEFNDFKAVTDDTENSVLQVQIEAFCKEEEGARILRAEVSILSKFTGFEDSSTDILLNHSYIDVETGFPCNINKMPIGYSKLIKGRQAVLWLRGGVKYALWNSFGSNFNLHDNLYSNGLDDELTPLSELVLDLRYGKLKAHLKTVKAIEKDDTIPKWQIEGALPLPKTLAYGVSLRNIRCPGSYIVIEADIANSITDGPLGVSGPFDLMVTGDSEGLSLTTQRKLMRNTGDEYTRVLAGNIVVIDWYLSTTPKKDYGFSGLYKFGVVDGYLLMFYHSNGYVPDFYINEDGELIAVFD